MEYFCGGGAFSLSSSEIFSITQWTYLIYLHAHAWVQFGWTNSASLGTVLSYVFYWIAVIVALVYLKWKEVGFMIYNSIYTPPKYSL